MCFLSQDGFFVFLVFLVHAPKTLHFWKKEKKRNQTHAKFTSGGRARAARGRGGRGGGGKTPKKKERRLESRVLEPLLETYEKRETLQFFLTNFSKSGVGQSKGGDEEEEERKDDVNDDDERGEEKDDDDDDDEKMRRLFAHGVSDAHEYALQSTVEEEEEKEEKETKEETFEDDEDANNRSKTDEDIISIVWFKEEEKGEEENSVVAKIVHERFKEYVTVHDPYLRDDGLLLSYVDLENEKRVDAYAFDRADGFGTFRKTRVIFFTVERKENGSDSEDLEREDGREDDDDDGEISFTIRKIEETFRNCGIEEEDGGYGRDMRIERATFDSRTNAAVFEFLPKGTSLFGETKTWRKNEKKEDDCTNPGATVKEGQSEEENEKEEVNEDEETTEFIRKRLPFCVSSFEEFGERANREAYSSARKALGDFFSSNAISKKRKNRKCDTVVQKPSVSESGVTTEEILDDKSRQEDNNEKEEMFTELEQEALRLELETASRRVAENSRAVLAQIDANKKHFQRHVLKERAESALRSVQKAKLLFEKTKVEEEAQREEDLTSKTSATLENGGTGSQQLADLSAAFRQARVNFIARQRRYDRARALFSSNGGSKKETTFCR